MTVTLSVPWRGIARSVRCCFDSCLLSDIPKVKPIRDEDGLAIDFEIEGEYPGLVTTTLALMTWRWLVERS